MKMDFNGGIKLEFLGAMVTSFDPVLRAITGKNDNGKQTTSTNTI